LKVHATAGSMPRAPGERERQHDIVWRLLEFLRHRLAYRLGQFGEGLVAIEVRKGDRHLVQPAIVPIEADFRLHAGRRRQIVSDVAHVPEAVEQGVGDAAAVEADRNGKQDRNFRHLRVPDTPVGAIPIGGLRPRSGSRSYDNFCDLPAAPFEGAVMAGVTEYARRVCCSHD
jgi:hypothetical protein